ncbi:MAG: PLDc N-terminal domain-containing protein [Spirosoma sp.]|nr:PLDc N-terminal domain-containing protein [Spirosoma sp.]
MLALMGLGGQELILIFVALFILAVGLLVPIIALIDIIRSDFRGSNDKLIWVIVVLFLNIIGAVLYWAIGRNQRVA